SLYRVGLQDALEDEAHAWVILRVCVVPLHLEFNPLLHAPLEGEPACLECLGTEVTDGWLVKARRVPGARSASTASRMPANPWLRDTAVAPMRPPWGRSSERGAWSL